MRQSFSPSLASLMASSLQAAADATGIHERPSAEVLALHRMGFGPRPGDVTRVQRLGLAKYVEEQLAPDFAKDPLCASTLAQTKIKVSGKEGAKEQSVPLQYVEASLSELWKLRLKDENFEARTRPFREVQLATLARGATSQWQLAEVMADFWHNHFNVYAWVDDDALRVTFPVYDRDVIRKHLFGNFRELLGKIARSVPMLVYLDNASSRSSPANENFARELFELHTLGRGAYINHLYKRWKEVPGAETGKPEGYIDEDVYEAARAFTGWTYGGGQGTQLDGRQLPNTGDFYFFDAWHDPYQKRVLGVELPSHSKPMEDGERVLDLVAFHPATARNLCEKLIKRFVSDKPPRSLVDRATKVWLAHGKSPDQIAHVLRTILLSDEFKISHGEKVKRPIELVLSYVRASGGEFTPNETLLYLLGVMGQEPFGYKLPTGYPDEKEAWLSTGKWLQRWNIPYGLEADWLAVLKTSKLAVPAEIRSFEALAKSVFDRVLGFQPSQRSFLGLQHFLQGGEGSKPMDLNDGGVQERLRYANLIVALTPEFQLR